MPKVKLTVSISEEDALYLRSKGNASSVVAEAVAIYRARELEEELEQAYREDAEESARLNDEWQVVDSEVNE